MLKKYFNFKMTLFVDHKVFEDGWKAVGFEDETPETGNISLNWD